MSPSSGYSFESQVLKRFQVCSKGGYGDNIGRGELCVGSNDDGRARLQSGHVQSKKIKSVAMSLRKDGPTRLAHSHIGLHHLIGVGMCMSGSGQSPVQAW